MAKKRTTKKEKEVYLRKVEQYINQQLQKDESKKR
jgi:hypothetical protein